METTTKSGQTSLKEMEQKSLKILTLQHYLGLHQRTSMIRFHRQILKEVTSDVIFSYMKRNDQRTWIYLMMIQRRPQIQNSMIIWHLNTFPTLNTLVNTKDSSSLVQQLEN